MTDPKDKIFRILESWRDDSYQKSKPGARAALGSTSGLPRKGKAPKENDKRKTKGDHPFKFGSDGGGNVPTQLTYHNGKPHSHPRSTGDYNQNKKIANRMNMKRRSASHNANVKQNKEIKNLRKQFEHAVEVLKLVNDAYKAKAISEQDFIKLVKPIIDNGNFTKE